jgi:hypothetical protein
MTPRLLPIHLKRLLMAYVLLMAIGSIWGLYQFWNTPLNFPKTSMKPTKESSDRRESDLPPIPTDIDPTWLDKRLRHIERAVVVPEPSPVESTPVPITQPVPAFAAELVATFIDSDPSRSHAVFRMQDMKIRLLQLGEAIEQSGETFMLKSVERDGVILQCRDQLLTISMKSTQ